MAEREGNISASDSPPRLRGDGGGRAGGLPRGVESGAAEPLSGWI